jgi:hypothetical protein
MFQVGRRCDKSGAFGLIAEISNDDGEYPDGDFGEQIQVRRP